MKPIPAVCSAPCIATAASARGRRLRPAPVLALQPISLAICLLSAGTTSFALPQGAVPTAGQTSVSVTAPGQMQIVQATPKAGLDWTSFSIGAGESVHIVQPGRSAVLLNRVLGDDPSSIYGTLTSNGSVWLINPRGIVFGASSRVDVGGLLASTLGLHTHSVADALASGQLQLGAGAGSPGELRAEGSITATDGSAVLVSPRLLQGGSITARRVGLASASELLVDVEGDGLVFFQVRNDRLAARLDQIGSVRADGGLAQISAAARAGLADTVLNVDGIVQARSIGLQQGRIVIDGGSSGITRVGGTLDATAAAGTGGSVLVQGSRILLDTQALLDASGATGGGSVRVGGDFQGSNASVRNADMVSVRTGARLAASAQDQGDGGTVIVWSDNTTRFAGAADARGGDRGGDGGLVEVSGKASLDFRGTSNRSAPLGRAGLLLLDPGSLNIGDTDDVDGSGGVFTGPTLGFADGAAVSFVKATTIQTLLAGGDLSLQAQDDIGVTTAINAGAVTNSTTGDPTSLELRAGKLIAIAAGASIGVSGNLRLSANDAATAPTGASPARVEVGAPLSAGGTITLTNNGGAEVHQLGANLTAASLLVTGDANVSADAVWTLSGASTLNGGLAGSAALTKSGAGVLTLASTRNPYTGALAINAGGLTLHSATTAAALSIAAGATLAFNSSDTITLGAIAGAGALRQDGSGVLQLDGDATQLGSIAVNNGALVLLANAAPHLGNAASLTIRNATLTVNRTESIGALTLLAGTVDGSSGLTTGSFASSGTSALRTTVNANTSATVSGGTLTVGDGATLAGALTGATLALGHATLVFNQPGNASLGAISGIGADRGTLQQDGGGELLLTAATDVAALRVNRGTLATQAAGLLVGTPTLTIGAAAAFRLGGAASVGALTLAGGTVSGSGTLSAAALASSGTSTVLADLLLAGNAQVASGTLAVGGGAGSSSGGLAFSVAGSAVQLGDNSTLKFDRGGIFAVGDVTGTASSALVLQQGDLTLNGDVTGLRNITAQGGTLRLAAGSADRIGNNAIVTVGSSAVLALDNSDETVGSLVLAGRLSGSRTLTASDYTLQNGSVVDAPLGGGSLRSAGAVLLNGSSRADAIAVDSGTLTLSGSGARLAGMSPVSVTVADGATLAVGGSESIATLHLAGTVRGAGTLTTSVLSSSGANAQIFGTVVASSAATVQAGGTLVVGNGATGSLSAGTVTLASSASTLVVDHSVPRSLDNVAGNGTLDKRGTGTLTLHGSANALGTLDVVAGRLVLTDAAGTQLGDGTAVTVRSAGILDTASGDETVGSLALAGVLGGTGTLRSSTSTALLAGSTVDSGVTLAGADISVSGAGTRHFNGSTSGSTALTVDQTATLVLGATSMLSDGADVAVLGGSRLTLGAHDTVRRLTLAGMLDTPVGQSYTLTTLDAPGGGSALHGNAQVAAGATLAGGRVDVTGAGVQLDGQIRSAELAIASGARLTLGLAERLLDTIHVDIAGGGTLFVNFAETIGSLSGGGLVNGPGALSTASFALNGQVFDITSTLTTGTLTSTGDSRVEGSLLVTGDATVTGGTLTVGNAAGTAGTLRVDGSTSVAQDAALVYQRSSLVTLGSITGAGTLRQDGSGELRLGGAAADAVALPFVDVNHGQLSLAAGNNNRLSHAGARVSVGSDGTFRLDNTSETIDRLVSLGTVAGSGTLTARDYQLSGGVVNAALGGGALRVDGAVTLNAATAANAISVSTQSGSFSLAAGAGLAATAALQLDAGATLTLAKDFTVATLAGSGHLANSGGTRTLTATGGSQLGTGARIDTNLAGGPLTVTGNAILNGAALLTGAHATARVSAGTLRLGSSADRLGGIAVTVDAGAGLALGSSQGVASLTLAGTLTGNTHTLTAGRYTLRDQAVVDATLGAGTLSSDGDVRLLHSAGAAAITVHTGTLTLDGSNLLTNPFAALAVATPATLLLAGDTVVRSLDLRGALAGSGRTLTALTTTLQGASVTANLGGNTLDVDGAAGVVSTLTGTAAAGVLRVHGGTLALASGGRLTHAAVAATVNGTLQLGGGEAIASLDGGGSVQLGSATLAAGSGNFGGALAGSGHLVKQGGGTLTLTGNSVYTGRTTVAGGSLVVAGTLASGDLRVDAGSLTLTADERLADTAAVAVATGAVFHLDRQERVASLALRGLLQGSGRLTAASYTLDNGTASAHLGGGSLTSLGSSLLNGSSAAGSVAVDSGTLTLATADRLTGTPAVTVAPLATLALGGNQTAASLLLQGSLLASAGSPGATLTAATYTLAQDALAAANFGSGALTVTGNSTLSGQAAVHSVHVTGGSLTLASADRLTALPAVRVDGGGHAALVYAGNQAMGALTLAGLLQGDGTGVVHSSSTTLAGGTVAASARLGSATTTVTASSALAGSSAAAAVDIGPGATLTLTAADRLDNNATVHVADNATLRLTGNHSIGRLNLAGTLDAAPGTPALLTAGIYALDGGRVRAALGPGTLTSRGASMLEASTTATRVLVLADTLRLQGADRLGGLPAVDVAAGATLRLDGAHTFGSLAGGGTVDLGSHMLRTGALGSSVFSGVLLGSGGLVKTGATSMRLEGDHRYLGATRIEGGVLQVAGTLASTVLDVTAGTLALAGADRLADGATVTVGSSAAMTLAGDDRIGSLRLNGGTLGGSGMLTAATYTLGSATVDAELGSGTLSATGSTRLNGQSGASSVTVSAGTLTLGSADRLADNAAVAVLDDGTLTLGGSDTVATLTLAGRLATVPTVASTLHATSTTLDGGTVDANLGGGTLVSSGNSRLNGSTDAASVLVKAGTLTLGAARRLTALPAVGVNAGAMLAMTGDQAFGSLAGAGNLGLGSYTLSTGAGNAGNTIFAGVISGSGGLIKQGASVFTLAGANSYSGVTEVHAGVLQIGDGGTTGSLDNSSGLVVDGTLRFARSDNLVLPQAVSGSGALEQAGSGRLLLSGTSKAYTGQTLASSGELATSGADMLADSTAVRVATGARLRLGGRETLRAIDADGNVALAGDLAASGDLLLRGAVTVADNQPIALSGQRIDAVNDGNVWGSSLALDAGDLLTVSSGRSAGAASGTGYHALTLGVLNAAAGGRIDAGLTTLAATTTLSGGTLELVSSAARAVLAPEPELSGKRAGSLPIAYAADAVAQGADSRILVAAGAELAVTSSHGGSVQLMQAGNSFVGTLAVRSGDANAPWTVSPLADDNRQTYALQGRVRIHGSTVNIGGSGIEADVVVIRADRLRTVGPTATIVARLPFDSTAGTAVSLPGLTLELTPVSFTTAFPFGESGAGNGLRVDVGSRAWGGRTVPLDAGYATVLPRAGSRGGTAVLLHGPAVNLGGGYQFYFDGAGKQSEIPVFYNGVLPTTPQVESSISATVAVTEGARQERFEEAVRTENVAVRLRAGVIAEVGPAPSATQGAEGVHVPATCPPAGNTLLCPVQQEPAAAPAARPARRAAP